VGYSDPNYFSYVFKRRFGVSPSKYRAEHIESEE
ncbi:MAG TPA: AraC family transcriptional regulator, partial [Candidatus Mediterraneibacter intestinigallinarum]|nr:AraC family transcriptional regulator [Candidatus Mediterraneibacter intestinigallinarum]